MRFPVAILICLCATGPAAGEDPDLRPIPFAKALVGNAPPPAATVVTGTGSDDPLVRVLAWDHAAGVDEIAADAVLAPDREGPPRLRLETDQGDADDENGDGGAGGGDPRGSRYPSSSSSSVSVSRTSPSAEISISHSRPSTVPSSS